MSTATITVGGGCTLDDAITSSNTDTATGGCVAGAGIDTIELTEDVTLTSALPVVTEGVVFEGNDHAVSRDLAAANFRILDLDLGGDVEVRNMTISNGVAGDGAGIRSDGADLTLFNSSVTNNEASGRGGGIYGGFSSSDILLQASTIAGNTAQLGGGIYTGFGSTTLIESSTVSNNYASGNGGGVYNVMYNYITITNSTISGNAAGDKGGGLYNQFYAGDMNLVSTTIAGNSALQGGGVYSYPAYESTPEGHITDLYMMNTVIANNVGGNCYSNFQNDLGGNFDDDGSCLGASPIAAGIDFDANLANNGGPTETHALLPGSAAIDSGGACGLTEDQRGFARDALCDSGSVEFGAAPVGGSIDGLRGFNASCRNNTTGASVTFPLGAGADDWNCEAQGLPVSPGDVVMQSVQAVSNDGGAGGTVIGLAAERVSCRNTTTGLFVNLALATGPSWDCVAAGLVVSPGDRVRMVSRGTVP